MSTDLNSQSQIAGVQPAVSAADIILFTQVDTLTAGQGYRISRFTGAPPAAGGTETVIAEGVVPSATTWTITSQSQIKQVPPVAKTPVITAISPGSAAPYDQVLIDGDYFDTTPSNNTVTVGGETATVLSASSIQLVIRIPAAAPSGEQDVDVTVGGLTSNTETVEVLAPPTLDSLTPSSAGAGVEITLDGDSFAEEAAGNTVVFTAASGTVNATITSSSRTRLDVLVPALSVTGNVHVETGSYSSGNQAFTREDPVLSSLSVSSGPIGTPVTITGTGFSPEIADNVVTFNGTTATVTAASETSLDTTVPSGATTGNVLVTIGTRTSNTLPFTVT